jgi:inner membrane protein
VGQEVAGRTIVWEDARMLVPIADVRGIREVRVARMATTELALEPDNHDCMKVEGACLNAVGAPVSIATLRSGQALSFQFEFELAGSETLRVMPLANRSAATLRSTWPHPNFSSGAFLPARRTVSDQGFDAEWQVLELNRGYAQSWVDSEVTPQALLDSAFGVDLYQPVDTYQRNTRATKYAILFIAITFMSIFLWEHAAGLRLHAMQYLLVGLGLSVFYLLLLALSEHLTFGWAYLVAAAALVMLIGSYMAGALRRRSAGFVAGSALAVVYALLYLLVLSEEYALLLGALLVFAVLAVIMTTTRRMDWYALSNRQESKPGS